MERVCKQCKRTFEVRAADVKRGHGQFCSTECVGNFRRGKIKKPESYISLICVQCSAEFTRSRHSLEYSKCKSGVRFCSRACKDKAQRLGGIKEIQPPHYGYGISTYRDKAFRSLPKQCNSCGYNEHPEILRVHHKDRNRRNAQLENLEVLCPNCHVLEHMGIGG